MRYRMRRRRASRSLYRRRGRAGRSYRARSVRPIRIGFRRS